MGKAIYFGIDNIIGALDRLSQGDGGFYYCVWQNSKSKCFQYNGGNYEDGIEYLRENLEPYADAGYTGDLYLKLHPNPCKHFFTWATEDICTLVICPTSKDLTPPQLSGIFPVQQPHFPAQQKGGKLLMTEEQWQEREALKNLPETIAGIIDAKLATLNLPVSETEPEDDSIQSVMIGHLKNPQLINKALDVLGQLIPMLKNPAQVRQVAGVPDTDIAARMEPKIQPPPPSGIVNNSYVGSSVDNPTDVVNNDYNKSDIDQKDYAAAANENITLTPDQEREMIAYNNKVDDALRRLAAIPGFDLADDLTALADYAEKNPETFNGLLPIVRNG